MLTICFSESDPAGPYRVVMIPRRSNHLRSNDLRTPEMVRGATDFSNVMESGVPVVVPPTRLESRRSVNARLGTTALVDAG